MAQFSTCMGCTTLLGDGCSTIGNIGVVEDGLQERGLSGVLFAAQQPIFSSHSQGCTPISEKLSIDEVQQNRVLRLDGRVIRGGLYISCVGRGRRQFGTNSEEPKLIAVGLTLFL